MYEKRSFKLINYDAGTEIESKDSDLNVEPRNAENSDPAYNRSTKNNSIVTVHSKDFEFTGGFAGFLIDAYISKGIESNVSMIEYRFHPNTDAPYIFLNAQFDFSQYSYENNIVKVPFLTGGLNALIKSKLSNKFETDRETSINGDLLPPQIKSEFAVVNRPLDLNSLLEPETEDYSTSIFRMVYNSNYRYGYTPIPTQVTYESDDSVLSVVPEQFAVIGFAPSFPPAYIEGDNIVNARSNTFYYNADVNKELKVNIKLTIKSDIVSREDLDDRHLSIRLAKFTGGDDPFIDFGQIPINEIILGNKFPDLDYFEELINLNNIFTSGTEYVNINIDKVIPLLQGESLALYLFGGGDFDQTAGNAYLEIDSSKINCSIEIKEQSFRSDLPRRAKCVLTNEVGRCLFGIINGDKDTYKSDYLENGGFKLSALASGKMIRGFKDEHLTTNLRDYFANCKALYNMAYNIEIINGKETLVHEPLRHFFRPQSIIRIKQQVNKVKRTVAKEFIYSSAKTGYKKPSGDNLYEEVNGLKEFNVSNEFVFPINRIVKEYENESPYRADSEGKELTIRQSIQVNPTGDYRTDNTIFNLDLKESGTSVYEERTYVDDFEEPPKNVFSPETVTGLRLTPFRNLSRHFWQLNAAFTKFTDKYIRYSSSNGNSDLITKKVGEVEIKENGDYQINTLENAIFASEWIEFEYPLDYDLINLVNGSTLIEGRSIPNTYFKVEFINEFNKKEYGYLYDLKPKKEGKWKLLKAL